MKRIFLPVVCLSVSVNLAVAWVGDHRAEAASTIETEITVLPTDCIFDFIDDGSGTIIFITPLECGVDPDEPDPDTNTPTRKVKRVSPLSLQGFLLSPSRQQSDISGVGELQKSPRSRPLSASIQRNHDVRPEDRSGIGLNAGTIQWVIMIIAGLVLSFYLLRSSKLRLRPAFFRRKNK